MEQEVKRDPFKSRIHEIDFLRGLLMCLVILDHLFQYTCSPHYTCWRQSLLSGCTQSGRPRRQHLQHCENRQPMLDQGEHALHHFAQHRYHHFRGLSQWHLLHRQESLLCERKFLQHPLIRTAVQLERGGRYIQHGIRGDFHQLKLQQCGVRRVHQPSQRHLSARLACALRCRMDTVDKLRFFEEPVPMRLHRRLYR